MSTLLHTPSYESNLTQGERLALCAGRFSPAVLGCDSEPLVRTVSVPHDGFRMPSMRAVREHDALLRLHGSSVNVSDDASEEEEESEEGDLYAFAVAKRSDSMREHSLLMPSQRGYAAAWQEACSCGYAGE